LNIWNVSVVKILSVNDVMVKIEDQFIPRKDQFRYLGSIIQKDGYTNEDITHIIKVRWLKWISAPGVLSNITILLKLKEKFYKAATN